MDHAMTMSWKELLRVVRFAAVVLLLDMAASYAVMFTWSLVLDPGHPSAYYYAQADWIVSLTRGVAGPLALFLVVRRWGRAVPERAPYVFAIAVWFLYLAMEGGMAGFQDFFTLRLVLLAPIKLAAALAGARFAVSPPSTSSDEALSQAEPTR